MSLWEDIPFHYLQEDNADHIPLESMLYSIMQGIDYSGRPFLAMKVWYQDEYCVGIIRQRWITREDEWDYGVPHKIMDVWTNPRVNQAYCTIVSTEMSHI